MGHEQHEHERQGSGDEPATTPMLITDEMLAPAAPAYEAGRVAAGDDRTDFERGMSYAPKLTIVLILANVTVFVWQVASGALESEQAIIDAGALHRPAVLAGEAWRLVTATFLHGGFEHLLGNCLALYILGMAAEHGLGARRTAAVYFASALCGSLLSVAMNPGPSVGASGAVFGLSSAVVVFLFKYQHLFFIRDKQIGFVLAAWAAFQIVTGFLNPYIDNFAHLGGLLGGAAVVLFLRPKLATPARA